MKLLKKTIQIYIVSVLFLTLSCSQYRSQSSNEFAERLNAQIKSRNFEQIYNEANNASKEKISKEEFLENMTFAVNRMREIDESLSWQKDGKVLLSNGDIAKDLYFVYRKIEKNGKKLDITITVAYYTLTPEFFDLCVSPSESSLAEDSVCVTNALRKT